MLDNLLNHIKYGNTYNCIEHSEKGSTEILRYLSAKLHKGELQIEQESYYLDSVKFIQQLPKNKSYHLIVNNEEVLSTTLKTKQKESKIIVQEAYPNIRLEDFFYECILGDITHVFICQKKYINDLIKIYQKEQIFITEYSLGFSSITSLRPYIAEGISVNLHKFTIEWDNNNLIAESANDLEIEDYEIEGISLSSENIMLFSAALMSYSGSKDFVESNFQVIEKNQQKVFLQHRFFKLALPITVGILFLLAVLNTITYTRYFSKVQELTQLTELNKSQREALLIKDSLVNKKQKLFEDVIKSTSSSSSFYIDQIASLKPKSINLSTLVYQPFTKRIRKDKRILLENNVIEIEGNLSDTEELSTWIRLMERESFVDQIAIENLFKKDENMNFTLRISINED